MTYLSWIGEHPFLSFALFLIAENLILRLACRTYRLIMVALRGWPTAPLMDADGDIVHPPKEKK